MESKFNPKKKSPHKIDANYISSKTTTTYPSKHKHSPTISIPRGHNKNIDPSKEFSRIYYSKDNFERVLLRNVLTPWTPPIDSNRSSIKKETIQKTSQSTRLPTDAFTKWKNEDKCHLLYCEADILQKEDDNVSFKRFDDAMMTNSSWMKGFEQEKNNRDLLFRQLKYNGDSKELLRKTMEGFRQDSVSTVVQKIDSFQKKVVRMPPVKKKKKKLQNFLTLNEDYGNFIDDESYEEDVQANFTFFWNILHHNLWKPGAREGATINSYEGKIYLYGGMSSELHSDLCELDIKNDWKWTRLKMTGDMPEGGRAGHSIICWKNGFLIFGGEKKYNKELKIRECFNDLRYLNLRTLEWKWIRPFGDIIESRRNNAYCSVGKWFFVHGGINNYNRYLNDLYAFNLEQMKWTTVDISNETEIDGIGFHTMCGVFKGEPRLNTFYHPFEYVEKKKINILHVGLYIFGGKTKSKESNLLSLIRFGTKPVKWVSLETNGIAPNPRYYHSMNHCPELNILIIYGGKTEKLANKQGESGEIFNDVWVLTLSNLNWIQVRTNKIAEISRCGHATTIFDSKLFVFGGYNKNNYISSNIFCLELNQKKAKNLMQESKKKTMNLFIGTEGQGNNEKIKETPNQAQIEIDDLESAHLKNDFKNRLTKISLKYNNLAFSNFKSFMPLPKREDLQKF